MQVLNQAHLGFPCPDPDCTTMIRPDIAQIMSGRPVYCPGCGLELQVDTQSSAKSLEQLKRLENNQEEIQALRKKATRFSKPQNLD